MTGAERSKIHSEEARFSAAVDEVKDCLAERDPQAVVFACDELIAAVRELGVAAFKASLPAVPRPLFS